MKSKVAIRFSIAVAGLVFAAMIAAGVRGEGTTPATMKRSHDPIQVPGELLKDLLGSDFNSLRVFACREGKMAQIPYQFDERQPDGTYIFYLGDKANKAEATGKLSPPCFLDFRLGDTGDRAPKSLWPAETGVEIELKDPVAGGVSYAYVIKFASNPPKQLETDTVVLENWDPWKSPELPFIVRGISYRIEGLVNKLDGKYYKTAVNKIFQVPVSAGGTNVNILDGQRMRAYVELLGGKYKIEKNETNMIGGIDTLTHGNVRGYGRQWLTVMLPLGIEGPRIYSDVFTYDRVIVSPMELNIPINPESIITRAGIEFGYDFNEKAYGMRFYSPNCMDGVTIDGKMTEKEKAISDAWVPWYLVTGPQGSLLFRVDVEQKLRDQTVNKLQYIDDLGQAFPPESMVGSVGYAREVMEIKSVKAGRYKFAIEWYFPPHIYKEGGYDKQVLQEFLDIKDRPILIRAGGQEAKNQALTPPMLDPKEKLKK
jgi:hypothetical protein